MTAKRRRTPAGHVGRPATIDAFGRTWTLAPWERERWVEFCAEYAAKHVPDPRQIAADFLKVLPPEHHDRVVDAAIEDAKDALTPGNPRVMKLLDTIDGSAYMLYLLLKPNHPEATPNLAWDILMEVGTSLVQAKMQATAGIAPRPKGRAGSRASPSPPSPTGDPGPPPGGSSTASSPASAG